MVVINDWPELANPAVYPEAKTILCGPYGAAMKAVRIRPGDCVVLMGDSYLRDPEVSAVLREAAPMSVVVAGAPERSEAVGQTQVRFVSPCSDAVIAALEDGQTERRSADEARPVLAQEEIDPELLRFLADPNLGKALLMVYDVEGDAPVRPGAIMVVDEYQRTFGTLGGSASQRKLVRTATGLIGTGRQETVDIPLDNDFNRAEGNYHQGTLRVVLADETDPSRVRT